MEGTPGGPKPMEMSDDEAPSPILPRLPFAAKKREEEEAGIPWRFSPVGPWEPPTPKYPVRSPEEAPSERARRRLDFAQLPSLEGLRKPLNPVTAPDALVVPALFPPRQQQQQQPAAAKAFQMWLDTYESARKRFAEVPHVIVNMPSVYAFQEEGAVPRYHGVNIFSEGRAFDRDQMPPQIRANLTPGGGGGLGGLGGASRNARVGSKERAVVFEFRQPHTYMDPHYVAGIDDVDASLFPLPREPFAPQWTLFRIVARAGNTGEAHWHVTETEGSRLARNFFGEASNVARFGVIFMEPDMPTRSYLFTRQPENPDEQ